MSGVRERTGSYLDGLLDFHQGFSNASECSPQRSFTLCALILSLRERR